MGFASGDNERISVRASNHVPKRPGNTSARWLAEGFMFEELYFIPEKKVAVEQVLEPRYRHGFTSLEEVA